MREQKQPEARGLPAMDTLKQDIRYAFRTLRRDRAFTVMAVLILGLGIGANSTVFSVVNTILLRPLPFEAPQRLVWIEGTAQRLRPFLRGPIPSMRLRIIERGNHSLQSVTAYFPFYGPSDYKLTGRGEPQPVSGVSVACNFFDTLGVAPMLGRLFTADGVPEECRPSRAVELFLLEAAACRRTPSPRGPNDHTE